MSERAKLIEERDKRFINYIKDKWTDADVARVEGLQAYYVSREMRKVATKFKLKLVPARARVAQKWKHSDASRALRHRLASKLVTYIGFNQSKKHPHQLAFTTGMTTAEQRRAINGEHDWTISQIERFAEAIGISFQELVTGVTPKPGKALDYGSRHS